ncbi:substrate-binding domain-containing protein [Kineosporia succinea]|uniref:Ribose transport system substrate-binding protein n=1 Tax=Kineosporia succinea TaxID=84632 RepID=A0ABT9PCP4_9ACTN|nr:substrate-binding domain-containing protein [Kineosporia succinea]MDP9830482.1 ribose transport system substrate-binding protein [Kineosporia succinea]
MQRRIRFISTVSAAAAVALMATACASGSSSSTGSGDGDGIKIGFSQVTQQSPFYVELGQGAKDAAAKAGDEMYFVDANGDVTKQNDDIQDLITRGVKVLIINPVDPKGVAPGLAAAKAAGVKVISVDRPLDGAVTYVGRDNVEMGKLVGEQLLKSLGSGGGKVLEIQGDAGGTVARDRSAGFNEALNGAPGVTVVKGPYAEYIRSKAVTAMQDLLQSNPDVKAVYCHNDDMCMGVLQVLKENNRDDVKVAGVDGLMEAVKAVADGGQYVATAVNDPQYEGQIAVDTAVKVAAGESVPEFIDAGTKLVDADTAKDLTGDALFAQYVPSE